LVPAIISLSLAGLFVFLAGFNAWIMLTSRGGSPHSRRLWTQAHRICGYTFIALFAIFCYFMLLRVRGSSDELSPRLILHMGLAFTLAPLLITKVIIVRYQKAAWGILMALGISIFVVAFTLVTVNVSVHYLRNASPHKVPPAISLSVVAAVIILALVAFFTRGKQTKSEPDAQTVSPMKPADREPTSQFEALNLNLARIDAQTPDAKTLRFLLPQGRHLGARPGQFLTFEWLIGGKTLTRSYSICSSPTQTGYLEITTKRVENGFVSKFLNDHAKVGLTVKARGPYGKFCFDRAKHERIVLIAAGSGITPMMAMLRQIDDLCIPTDATLIYCVRTEQDVFFKDELAALPGRLSTFRYVLVLSRPGPDWKDWKGRLRREILEREVENLSESTFFLCGPPAFMQLGRTLLKDLGIEPSRILQESFGSAVAGEQHSTDAGPLEIKFSRSAVAYKILSADTLLESSEKNGVLIPSGCRQGVCGTCATRLLSGRVRMETEEALSDELRSQGVILPCVSRPLSDVTLDA
jgi:glycine betaine catabolism B